eukprot:gene5291-5958_t
MTQIKEELLFNIKEQQVTKPKVGQRLENAIIRNIRHNKMLKDEFESLEQEKKRMQSDLKEKMHTFARQGAASKQLGNPKLNKSHEQSCIARKKHNQMLELHELALKVNGSDPQQETKKGLEDALDLSVGFGDSIQQRSVFASSMFESYKASEINSISDVNSPRQDLGNRIRGKQARRHRLRFMSQHEQTESDGGYSKSTSSLPSIYDVARAKRSFLERQLSEPGRLLTSYASDSDTRLRDRFDINRRKKETKGGDKHLIDESMLSGTPPMQLSNYFNNICVEGFEREENVCSPGFMLQRKLQSKSNPTQKFKNDVFNTGYTRSQSINHSDSCNHSLTDLETAEFRNDLLFRGKQKCCKCQVDADDNSGIAVSKNKEKILCSFPPITTLRAENSELSSGHKNDKMFSRQSHTFIGQIGDGCFVTKLESYVF